MYIFKDELVKWIEKKGVTRKELIALLQHANYEEFKGLDAITVSRWINGKTTPQLYKQLYIAKYLDADLLDIICRVSASSLKLTEKMIFTAQLITKNLDFSSLSISYKKQPNKTFCKIKKESFSEHYHNYSEFHSNIGALEFFFEELYNLKNKVSYKSITLENSSGDLIGHYSGITNITPLHNLSIFKNMKNAELDKSVLINVGFFSSYKHYLELLDHAICYYLFSLIKKVENLYLFVAGSAIYEITKNLLGMEMIDYFPPNNSESKIGVYLFKIDILKAICNPLLFPSAQKKLKCALECKSCNLCNLKDFL